MQCSLNLKSFFFYRMSVERGTRLRNGKIIDRTFETPATNSLMMTKANSVDTDCDNPRPVWDVHTGVLRSEEVTAEVYVSQDGNQITDFKIFNTLFQIEL